ncbi:hypothetical protein [Mesorhizobium waimense]|uniref:hypothetical protein n=1 Tax=Mesorhizobium waimense TaxID=1300307 RepID=UPI001FE0B5E6|nr:hypothetical protein [Mesorhizobium waimense]
MLIVVGKNDRRKTLLFPITSQPPLSGARCVEIPETEARRAKLYTPAWVIVDEFNTDDLATSWRSKTPSLWASFRANSCRGLPPRPPRQSAQALRKAFPGDSGDRKVWCRSVSYR